MPKASPHVRSFNTGETSELLRGRTDLERHPSSLQRMYNTIAAPQGPAISRSGTAHMALCATPGQPSYIEPFVFSNDDAYVLEFAEDRIRFLQTMGLLTYGYVDATVISAEGDELAIMSDGLDAEVGDDVLIAGAPITSILNFREVRVTSKVGNLYSFGGESTPEPSTITVARVYHISSNFTLEERQTLRFVQSLDVVYIFNEVGRMRKLSRRGVLDWVLEELLFSDGPYLSRTDDDGTTLTFSGTGGLLGQQASAIASSTRPLIDGTDNDGTEEDVRFLGRAIDYELEASDAAYAFDTDVDTYWAGGVAQTGSLTVTYAAPRVVSGYTIYASRENQDGTYLNKDYAPSSWVFEGRDVSGAWIAIDTQEDYVLYDNNKSIFFEVSNTQAYASYRITIKKLVTNGMIEARVQALVLKERQQQGITVTASSTNGINFDEGFKNTDVDRALRVRGSDGSWRELRISAVISPTQVQAELIGEPLIDLLPIARWRLGVWSDTTGWPSVGVFFGDRLFVGGAKIHRDTLAMSAVGSYEVFSPTDSFGQVLDDNGAVFTLNARRLSRIRWMTADRRGVLLGTGSIEYTIRSASGPFTARTAEAVPATGRGSAALEPEFIDDSTLFVQRSGRTLREFKYIFEADGYRSPSLSSLASHLGAVRFKEMEYASEPHGIMWLRREDGSLVGFTYDTDQGVQGWHQHDLSGGKVISMAVIPDLTEQNDNLWVVVMRTIKEQPQYSIERLTRMWDFDMTLEDAWFVDAGVRYRGELTDVIGGFAHLEGEEVYGLSDGTPVGPIVVTDGMVQLPFATDNAVIGLGFESECVTAEIMNGSADGTAAGKTGRMHNMVARVWATAVLEIGVWVDDESEDDKGLFKYDPFDLPKSLQTLDKAELYTGMTRYLPLPPSYTQRTVLAFRRPKGIPLPMNIVALMPQLHKQDR